MAIPLLDLNRQFDSIENEIRQAIDEVLQSQHFIMGQQVKDFEEQVARYCDVRHAYGCASGSDALLLALMAIDLQPGDYVLTTPFTFFATAGAISRLGGIPVFLDIEKDSYNINPEQVRLFLEGEHPLYEKLEPEPGQTKAIIPVHLYGQMADMHPLQKLADEYNLYVIEDAAQAIGAEYKSERAGSMGDFGCFSFFPSKNLGAFGDAGLVTVKNDKIAQKTDILRLHGAKPKYHHSLVGINSRLDTLQAAILGVKLKYLNEWSTQRKKIADTYNQLFEEAGVSISTETLGKNGKLEDPQKIVLPAETTGQPAKNGRHIYHQYTIRTARRESVQDALKTNNIGHSIYYPIPLHQQECFKELGYQKDDCPVAATAAEQVISLPVFPELGQDEIEQVVETVVEAVKA